MGFLLHTAERQNVRLVHEVEQATRRADQNIAAFLELLSLVTDGSTSVHDAGTKHRTVAKTASLIKDLGRKLAGRSHDENQRFSTYGVDGRIKASSQIRASSCELFGLSHQLRKNGNEKRSGFSGTCLISHGLGIEI